MDGSRPTPDLSELRRQLEEILALLSSGVPGVVRQESSANLLTTGDSIQTDEPDELFDDALVVLTEFGQATPAILQMWLSIDYARAARILRQFETQGLVSPKGRVRHKAYELRRIASQLPAR